MVTVQGKAWLTWLSGGHSFGKELSTTAVNYITTVLLYLSQKHLKDWGERYGSSLHTPCIKEIWFITLSQEVFRELATLLQPGEFPFLFSLPYIFLMVYWVQICAHGEVSMHIRVIKPMALKPTSPKMATVALLCIRPTILLSSEYSTVQHSLCCVWPCYPALQHC